VAILVGLALAGAFAGVGLYFGLRDHATSAPPASATASSPSSAGLEARPLASSPAAPTEMAPEAPLLDPKSARVKAVADVERAFAAKHAQLLRDCWAPSVARAADPPQVVITFTLGYGPDGHPTTRALAVKGTNVRADVAACVNREVEAPEITPLGERVRVSVDLTLP
jgi:hypothetical protein